LAFAATAAAKLPPMDLTASHATDVEFIRDIRPILQRSCATCHSGATPAGNLNLADTTMLTDGSGLPIDYARLAWDRTAAWGYKPVINGKQWRQENVSRYVRALQSRRSLLTWKLYGQRLDGWANSDHPTEAVPGDVSTLPTGADPNYADLDFGDTANHPAMLPIAEKRLIARWIDTGLLLDQGGAFGDETRPTLALTPSGATLIVGAADAYSGLMGAPTATVDGVAATLTSLGGGRWSTPVTAGSHVVAGSARDVAGNITNLTRTLTFTLDPQTPVACVVSDWSAWSAWTPVANSVPPQEQRTRTRTIVTPPSNGGAACPALSETETRAVVPPDPCVVNPLKVTGIRWPTGQTGNKSGTWNSGTFTLVEADFLWNPLRFVAKDSRGCSVTVPK
jgi:hypothetical protein